LRFRLTHVAVEIVEIAQALGTVSCICVGWIESLMMFDIDEDIKFPRFVEKVLMFKEQLDGGLSDEDMDSPADGI